MYFEKELHNRQPYRFWNDSHQGWSLAFEVSQAPERYQHYIIFTLTPYSGWVNWFTTADKKRVDERIEGCAYIV